MADSKEDPNAEQRAQLERIRAAPGEGMNLSNLTQLDIRFQGLSEVPKEVCLCTQLYKLDMGCNKISNLPKELVQLKALRILFLTSNAFTQIPKVLCEMKDLRMLSLMRNQIQTMDCNDLPAKIQWLIMTDNNIGEIKNFGRLSCVRKLMLSHNHLDQIPDDIKDCESLQMIRLANNKFESIPKSLFTAPNLAWLAISGNPITRKLVEGASGKMSESTTIDYETLEFGDALGEGSGGKVRNAMWKKEMKKVAVKEYRGSRFSDGTAKDEWLLNRSLPKHDNVLVSLGSFSEPHLGLVLPLMENATSVGGPPSLDSCTRDTHPRDMQNTQFYSTQYVTKVALAVCNGARLLHSRCIAHGDIYLHNTLHNPSGSIKLSDFGAAFHYPKELSAEVEGLEVRSFGFLILDLLKFSQVKEKPDETTRSQLKSIANSCTKSGDPKLTGKFADLCEKLEALIDQ
mmetsp:Transcript_15020/g.27041  ORF Transcript_15020/g.27041 Transcript_15020/m.27041 type:complete len:457 (+) Transcript_15020:127-1497(+)|eukprot:CAMPEP_0197531610 /NCGR_PEP_ID=MMETSP1318-20131121/36407_1 /TAXON_ID=552666 /ORGANISM="Partenskyella glossopodia, Strain RCC365" /LENGTH=456 /DNA_ID=CAMNT_0043087895 /DNA_START=29 /DNA_END=1399 /DNA_ORIENTATION=+